MRVRLYATLRQTAETSQVDIPVDSGQTVGDVLHALTQRYPKLHENVWQPDGSLVGHVTVILNGRDIRHLSGVETPVSENDALFVFPPVGGGTELDGLTHVTLRFASHFRARVGQSQTEFTFKGRTLRAFVSALLKKFDIADLLLEREELKPNVRVVINGRYSSLLGGWAADIPDGATVVLVYAYGITY